MATNHTRRTPISSSSPSSSLSKTRTEITTDEEGKKTTLGDLSYFRYKRDRWLNAERQRIKPFPPTSPEFYSKTLPLTSGNNNNLALTSTKHDNQLSPILSRSPDSSGRGAGAGGSPIGTAFLFGASDKNANTISSNYRSTAQNDEDDNDDSEREEDDDDDDDGSDDDSNEGEDGDNQETRTPVATPSFGSPPTSFGVSSTMAASNTTSSSGSAGGAGLFSFSAASFALPKPDSVDDSNTTTKTPFSSSTPSSFSFPSPAGTPAFPPIAKKAPTPFGSNPFRNSSTLTTTTTTSSSAESVQSSTKARSSAPPDAAAASFPPMSTKAPTPFGQSKLTSSSTSSATASVPSSVSSTFPPMSAKAPTPFGQSRLKTTTTTTAAFPPMSTVAPKKPFSGSAGSSEVTASSQSAISSTKSTENKVNSRQTIDYRTRLLEFYKKHNPSKVDTVDDTLTKYKGKEEEMFRKLRNKYESGRGSDSAGASGSKFPLPGGDGPTCYIDFSIDNDPAGRVVFKLYADKAPLCAENFRCLCTGEKGEGRCYKNSKVHRVVPSFVVQLGDYTKGDGTGGKSIYQPGEHGADMWGKFKDEPFMQHSRPGLLSMANSGKNTNSSQFFVTLKATPHLDGKHNVFGEVIEGMEVIDKIVDIPTDKKSLPVKAVVVADCGEIKNGVDYPATMVAKAARSSPFGIPSTFGAGSSSNNTMSFSALASGNNVNQSSSSPAFGGFGSSTPSPGFGEGSGSTSVFGATSSLGGANTSSTAFGTATNGASQKPTGFSAFSSSTVNAQATPGISTTSAFGGSTSFGEKKTLSSTAFGSNSTNGKAPSFGALAAGGPNTNTNTKTESKSASNAAPSPFGAFSQNNSSPFSFGSTAASTSNDKPSPFSAFSGSKPSAFNFKPSTTG